MRNTCSENFEGLISRGNMPLSMTSQRRWDGLTCLRLLVYRPTKTRYRDQPSLCLQGGVWSKQCAINSKIPNRGIFKQEKKEAWRRDTSAVVVRRNWPSLCRPSSCYIKVKCLDQVTAKLFALDWSICINFSILASVCRSEWKERSRPPTNGKLTCVTNTEIFESELSNWGAGT